jgi:mono/diheme cytochrome c family protein
MRTQAKHRAVLVCIAMMFSVLLTVAAPPPPQSNTATIPADSHSVYAEIAAAPAKARAKRNPLEGQADAVAAGGKLFSEHCAECHGSEAQGGRKAPSLRSEEVQQAPSGALFWILTNGVVRQGMPVWSKLPEPERWQIVTFLKSLGGSGSPAADHPPGKLRRIVGLF